MAKLIDSVKALGEKITGEKINGDTLFDAVKDAGEKMTGKEIEGKELNDLIAETAKEYQGGGGTVVVNELPETGDPNTIYELHQEKPADFPWLLTEFYEGYAYPQCEQPFIVVENEDQVTREYLQMPWDFEDVVFVYVKSTNNVYTCRIEEGEQENTFEKEITYPEEHSLYLLGEQSVVLLSDFDYHVTGEDEEAIPDGTGHYLDGTVFEYDGGSVPLVLTDGNNKKILLSGALIGFYDATGEEIPDILVTKIDLSLDPENNYAFAPKEPHTEVSYWIYANNKWVNMNDIGGPSPIIKEGTKIIFNLQSTALNLNQTTVTKFAFAPYNEITMWDRPTGGSISCGYYFDFSGWDYNKRIGIDLEVNGAQNQIIAYLSANDSSYWRFDQPIVVYEGDVSGLTDTSTSVDYLPSELTFVLSKDDFISEMGGYVDLFNTPTTVVYNNDHGEEIAVKVEY